MMSRLSGGEFHNQWDECALRKSSRTMTKLSGGECHNRQYDCDPSKSSRTMTKLSGGECHNHTMKRVGCDPHAMTSKVASLKRRPSGHM